MLSALHYAVDLIHEHRGIEIDLATIPQEPEVYDMLCRADTVGVFQIESRAQMATLPRLRPRTFYDLVVEIALIRPGPIQGGSVHPYIRRRNGKEPVTYLHPLLENSLAKTLGVPLFQEQLMQMAIDVAGFTPAEADELRQAMGSKRSRTRMERLRERLYEGMAERGIDGPIADELFDKMAAFANYGFPESHSVSFAYLVYASSWIKYHEPAAFCAALLNAQPMGFWSPHSLVRDARRHGVVTHTPDLNASKATATLEPWESSAGGLAVRLGIGSVRGIGAELADEIEAGSALCLVGGPGAAGAVVACCNNSRRWPPPGCSPSVSGSHGEKRCGRWGGRPVPPRSAGRVWSPGPNRLACQGWGRSRKPLPTCGPPACRPRATRPSSCGSNSTGWGW